MEVRDRIVKKAHELFMRYGIRSVSMDDVASQLGMSKKTIYQFYADKDSLVEDVIDIELHESECTCANHKALSSNAIDEIFLAMDMMQELLSRMNPNVIFDMEKYHPNAFKKYNEFKNKFLYTMIKQNLEKGKEEGLYRPEVNTEIMTRFRLASTFLVFNPDLFPLGKHSLATVIIETTDNFLCGLATAKGLKLIQKYKQHRLKTTTL